MNNYELIKFQDDDFELDVNVSPEEDTAGHISPKLMATKSVITVVHSNMKLMVLLLDNNLLPS